MLTAKQLDQTFEEHNGYNIRDLKRFSELQEETIKERRNKSGFSGLMAMVCKKINKDTEPLEPLDFNDILKLYLTIHKNTVEVINPPESQKGTRKNEVVMVKQITIFLVRFITPIPLHHLCKMVGGDEGYHHSSVIHSTQQAFDKIDIKDERFMEYFNEVLTRLRTGYGIIVNFEDMSKWPDWYKKLKTKHR